MYIFEFFPSYSSLTGSLEHCKNDFRNDSENDLKSLHCSDDFEIIDMNDFEIIDMNGFDFCFKITQI